MSNGDKEDVLLCRKDIEKACKLNTGELVTYSWTISFFVHANADALREDE